MQVWHILQSLLLLTLANGTPVIVKKWLGPRFAAPLDAGVLFLDGQPLLGSSKTVRGVLASIVVTAAIAPLLGTSVAAGGLVAALAMAGDLISSFLKRRLKLPPSSRAIGLDQVPESLLPLLVCRGLLALSALDVAVSVALFLAGELIMSRLLYALHIRDQPY
jgi:CDP-archaeol synthase